MVKGFSMLKLCFIFVCLLIGALQISAKTNCSDSFIQAVTVTGLHATNSNSEDTPLFLTFSKDGQDCVALAKSSANFSHSRVTAEIFKTNCNNVELIQKARVYDLDCNEGIRAEHRVSQDALKASEDAIKTLESLINIPEILAIAQKVKDEYESTRQGYLSVEAGTGVLISFE